MSDQQADRELIIDALRDYEQKGWKCAATSESALLSPRVRREGAAWIIRAENALRIRAELESEEAGDA